MDTGSLKSFSAIAYRCVKKASEERPMMAEIVEELEFSLEQQEIFEDTPGSSHRERTNLMLNSQTGQSPDSDHGLEFESSSVRFQDRADDDYSRSPPVSEGYDSYDSEDGPGIEGFKITGDAKLGSTLVGCGFAVRGTLQCMFQWVRHFEDGTWKYIERATNQEYVVTVDDVDKLIALECIPMDNQGRQGKVVRLFANGQNKITCDPEMQQDLDNYMLAGRASFSASLLMDSPVRLEETNFSLRRSKYQIKINHTKDIFIHEKYPSDLSIKVHSGLFVLLRRNRSSHTFSFRDDRMRDTFVLTMRMFQSKALDERRKTTA